MGIGLAGLGGQLGSTLKDKGGPFGIISATGAFISDVLEPIAPFCEYIFYLGGSGAVVLLVIYAIYQAVRGRLVPALLFMFIATGFAGMMFAMQGNDEDENGFLADVIPGITAIQETLGLVQKDLQEIKETTANLQKDTEQIRQTTAALQEDTQSIKTTTVALQEDTNQIKSTAAALQEKTDQINNTTADIQQDTAALRAAVDDTNKKIDQLSRGLEGGIIRNPSNAKEYYHNARIHELDGNYTGARLAYAQYFRSSPPYVDTYARYGRLLRLLEGQESAREQMAALPTNPAQQLGLIELYPRKQRLRKLTELAKAQPKFGPVHYKLSRHFSAAQLGEQTVSDKRQEKAALEKVIALHEKGHFSRWYLQKEEASKALEDAKTRLRVVAAANLDVPLSFQSSRSNQGWSINTWSPEARQFYYRIGRKGKFKSLGFSGYKNPETGAPMPNGTISLPPDIGNVTLYIKYKNPRGQMEGPYPYRFEPMKALRENSRRILEMQRHAWISLRRFDGRLLMYWTPLVSYRCALKRFHYGIDTMAPKRTEALAACDPKDPYRNRGKTYITLDPPANEYISVQLTYADGTRSEVMKYTLDTHLR